MTDKDAARAAVANRLRLARGQAGLSQAQVARLLGLSRPSVTEIEAGRRRVSAEELATLAEIYGVDTAWVTGSPSRNEPSRDRVELAARELSKLKDSDLQRLLELLQSLRKRRGGKE